MSGKDGEEAVVEKEGKVEMMMTMLSAESGIERAYARVCVCVCVCVDWLRLRLRLRDRKTMLANSQDGQRNFP